MKTAKRLRQFRERCEQDAGTHASKIEVPLLSVLADVCRALQLSPNEKRQVLGRRGKQVLSNDRAWTIAEPLKRRR